MVMTTAPTDATATAASLITDTLPQAMSRSLLPVPSSQWPLLLLLVVAATLYLFTPSAAERCVRHLPRPAMTLPVLHNTLDVLLHYRGRVHDYLLDETRRQRGAMWCVRLLGRPVTVVLTSPAAFEHVLKTRFEDFGKGELNATTLRDVLGRGIFAVDGAHWLHQRKTASHLFSLQRMRDTMENAVRHYSATLCVRLADVAARSEQAQTQTSSSSQQRSTVDVKRLLDLFTMDVFTQIGFGVDLRGLASGENAAFLDAFERASRQLFSRFQAPCWLWQLRKWLNVGRERQMRADVRVIDTFVLDIIRRSVEAKKQQPQQANEPQPERRSETQDASGYTPRARSGVAEPRKDLISLFLDSAMREDVDTAVGDAAGTKGIDTSASATNDCKRDGADDPEQTQLIRDMALNFLAAGRDTTSQSMAWFLIMLNRHPRVLQRVRHELATKLPHLIRFSMDNSVAAMPTMEDVAQLTFLEAALRESIRLNPVVAVNSRTALRDTTLHDGTHIVEGTRVLLPHYVMARLTSVWGPDAEQYNPERWIDTATGRLTPVSPFQFTAFLAGPRACLGMRFALMEMKIAMAAVLSRFELATVRDPFAFTYSLAITLAISGPVDVRVRALHRAGDVDEKAIE